MKSASTTEPTTPSPTPTPSEPVVVPVDPPVIPSASPSAGPVGPDGSGYVALSSPVRVMDSRNGTGTPMEQKVGQVPLDLSSVIPEGASAAVLNITTAGVTQPGYLVVYADEPSGGGTSNQNLVPGEIRANEVVAALPASRRLVVHVRSAEPVDLIADLVGYFSPDTGGQLDVRTPTRVFDSRKTSNPLRSGETVVDLSDHVPDGASTVVLNVTTTGAAGPGFVVAYPTGTSKPRTSNVNFARGLTVANEAFVRLGTSSDDGHVTFVVNGAPSVLVVDLWAVVVGEDSDGLVLDTIAPTRALDTRYGIGTSVGRRFGRVTVPLPESVPATAKAVVMTVTITGTAGQGYVTAFPSGDAPLASALNFSPGATKSNQVVVGVGPDRTVQLLIVGSDSPQSHVIADVLAVLE